MIFPTRHREDGNVQGTRFRTSIFPVSKAVTWQGYASGRLRRNFLELFLRSKYNKTRENSTSRKAPNFLEVPLRLRSPPPGTGVKTLPVSKSQKGVSARVSGGVSKGPGRPAKKSRKLVSGVKKQVIFDSGESPGDSLLTLFLAGSAGTPQRRPPQGSYMRNGPVTRLVTGKIVGQPRKGNVEKMSEKCREKMSENCPEGLKTQI